MVIEMDFLKFLDKANYVFPNWWLLALAIIFGFLRSSLAIRVSYFIENLGYDLSNITLFGGYYEANIQKLKQITKESQYPSIRLKSKRYLIIINMYGFLMLISMLLFIISNIFG